MASYFRVMLGPRSIHAPECLTGGFIGTDFGSHARSRATSSDGDVGQGALGSDCLGGTCAAWRRDGRAI